MVEHVAVNLILSFFMKSIMNSKQQGNITELETMLAFLKLGYNVLTPYGDCERYDFVADVKDAFENSQNITDFSHRIVYKNKIHRNANQVTERLTRLGLSLDDLKKTVENPMSKTKGEIFDMCSSWQAARSLIATNARTIYMASNRPKQCACCGYDKHFEVAHIKAVSSFDKNVLLSEINAEDNLIALCPNHHWEYDNTDFDITPYLVNMG